MAATRHLAAAAQTRSGAVPLTADAAPPEQPQRADRTSQASTSYVYSAGPPGSRWLTERVQRQRAAALRAARKAALLQRRLAELDATADAQAVQRELAEQLLLRTLGRQEAVAQFDLTNPQHGG